MKKAKKPPVPPPPPPPPRTIQVTFTEEAYRTLLNDTKMRSLVVRVGMTLPNTTESAMILIIQAIEKGDQTLQLGLKPPEPEKKEKKRGRRKR